MDKQFSKKISLIIVLFIIIISFFLKYPIYAVTDDDGPDVSDESIDWTLTCFNDGKLGTGFVQDNFTTNLKYGWCEYEKDGTTYVVLAAATHELLNSGEISVQRYDYIHYFNYYDTIQFKFVDENFDNNTYNGIILDSCGASMNPTAFHHASNEQVLDVYFKTSTYSEAISGQHVKVTMNGTFSPSAGTTKSAAKRDSFVKLIVGGINLFADTIQIFLNGILADTKKDTETMDITYSKSEIEEDDELKEQIQVSDESSNKNKNIIKEIDVSNLVDNKKGEKEVVYTKGTKIPVIPADIYSASNNQANIFDIDFFNASNDNPNKFWKFIKNIVSGFSHVVIYLSAVLILVMLIWRSILLVFSAIGDDPQGASESKKIMDGVLKAICIIGGIYVFMTLMMYFYQEILTIVLNGKDSNYLIRVNVENVYSFNTNFIGYLKYMTLKSDVATTLGSSIVYAVVAIINLFWFGFMFVRMFIIAGLTIIAPITAVNAMLEKAPRKGFHIDNIFHFKSWTITYLRWLWTPLIVGIIMYKFLLLIG